MNFVGLMCVKLTVSRNELVHVFPTHFIIKQFARIICLARLIFEIFLSNSTKQFTVNSLNFEVSNTLY